MLTLQKKLYSKLSMKAIVIFHVMLENFCCSFLCRVIYTVYRVQMMGCTGQQ